MSISGYNPGYMPAGRPTAMPVQPMAYPGNAYRPLPQAPMIQPTAMGTQMRYTSTYSAASSGGGVSIPGGKVFAEFDGGGLLETGGNLAHIYNMAKTGITGGKPVNSAIGQLWRSLKGLHGNGIFSGIKGVIGGAIPFAAQSGLFEGAISAVVNGYRYFTHRESIGTAGGNVVGDTLAGFAGGAGAAVGGAIVMAVLPFGGTMGLILTGIGGIFGFGAASSLIRGTGIYNTVVGGVRRALGG